MGHIRVLPGPLIDRIAAGEVVERPASVVKELVENSLDAGAGSVEVTLLGGGKQSIRVIDDGRGMDRDDALLAVERHATSKLTHADQLQSIETLGFRGEALSSIAAVSRFTLRTAREAGVGTEVEIQGGRIRAVREIGQPAGTSVSVERLFYNVPARRKFLRSDATELAHVLRWITRYALSYPSLRFHLRHGERRLLDAAPADDERQRIAQIFGRDLVDRLLAFEGASGGVRVRGHAGRPVDSLPRRDAQHLFVNGRAVQDRVLGHAVSQAYGNTMPSGRYPAMFLYIEMNPAVVDVNVHPQKTEVRFRHASEVHDLVRDTIGGALAQRSAVPRLSDLRPGAVAGPDPEGHRRTAPRLLEVREPARVREDPVTPGAAPRPVSETFTGHGGLVAAMEGASERRAIPLAQFRDSYIVAEDPDGLLLVDQHAAHERVLFEQYLAEAEANRVEVQKLMFPVTVELAPHERILLETELDEFRRLGFLVEPFGGSAVKIDGVPALAADLEPERLLREMLGEAAAKRAAASDVGPLRRRLVTTAACHAAIKINHPLSAEAMQGLLDRLYRTNNPTTCPHGRPSVFRLTVEEIERTFRRR